VKITVIGAGVVGVAAAHALAEREHEAHVYDRRSDIASDTTASTAGLIAPGHSDAWASPTAPGMLVRVPARCRHVDVHQPPAERSSIPSADRIT
jgi:D-amino-acid dehydrogenase